ncbi:MAG: phage tail tape measure protein [Eubacteriales bacterium]|nr:phage tail tape measure protein [Eubacteriales bacterium]
MGRREYELAVKITGMIDKSLKESTESTKKELRSLEKEAKKTDKSGTGVLKSFEKAGTGIDKLWGGALKTVKAVSAAGIVAGTVVGAVGTASIHAGSEFESAFAGVKKTVEATAQEYKTIEDEIREMAKQKPQTASELSKIAESAGQLGIQKKNLMDFTDTVADLKESTNLGDEGAEQLAKFANITRMPQTQFRNLGSTVTELGNHLATTEADIVSMSLRLAGAGEQVGMTEADIMGMAGALSSLGIEAEAGGSAYSKLMIKMQLAVETGSDSLQDYASVAGMSTSKFKKAFQTDAAGAIGMFLKGLNDTKRTGKTAIAMLDEMGIKEVRLRDSILRSSNANELFDESLEMANRAFEENKALTIEAEKRYRTLESQLGIAKNRITDVGISLYQEMRPALSECLQVAMDFADGMDITDSDFISRTAKNLRENVPTVVRNLREAKDTVSDFAVPFMEAGEWMAKNPDVIVGTLTGIGTAIVSLKLAKEIAAVASSMKLLYAAMASNPITAAIGIAAIAGGAIMGISTKVKMAAREAARADLDKHFGSIALSMGQIEDAAKQIVNNGNMEKFSAAMEEMEKVKRAAEELRDANEALNRLNWKSGMGMLLSETDQEELTGAMDSMVQSAIELVEQNRYTAHVNVSALFGEDSEIGNEILSGLDYTYASLEAEIKAKGEQLGNVYADALTDGIINPKELERIRGIQDGIMKLTQDLTRAQFEAQLSGINMEYSGGALTPDSFQNMQAELDEQIAGMQENIKASRDSLLTGLHLRHNRGEISDTEFKKQMDAVEEQFNGQELEIELRRMKFSTDAIQDVYADVFREFSDGFSDEADTALGIVIEQLENRTPSGTALHKKSLMEIMGINKIDKASRDAMSELWESMEPDFYELQKKANAYTEAGKKIPYSLAEGLKDSAMVGAISGNADALYQLLILKADGTEYEQKLRELAYGYGNALPTSILAGISDGSRSVAGEIDPVIEELRSQVMQILEEQFGEIEVNTRLKMNVSSEITNLENVKRITARKPSVNYAMKNPVRLEPHAEGGIFDTPHYGVLAEEGPEAYIPLDGSQNAKSIWQEAGEFLGVISPAGPPDRQQAERTSNDGKIEVQMVFQIYGEATEGIRKASEDAYDTFRKNMEQWKKDNRRLSY